MPAAAGGNSTVASGAPIAMLIRNRDWKNWQEIMDPAPRDVNRLRGTAGGNLRGRIPIRVDYN